MLQETPETAPKGKQKSEPTAKPAPAVEPPPADPKPWLNNPKDER